MICFIHYCSDLCWLYFFEITSAGRREGGSRQQCIILSPLSFRCAENHAHAQALSAVGAFVDMMVGDRQRRFVDKKKPNCQNLINSRTFLVKLLQCDTNNGQRAAYNYKYADNDLETRVPGLVTRLVADSLVAETASRR